MKEPKIIDPEDGDELLIRSLAACLHKQMERLRTMPPWEFVTRPTKAEMVEEMRQELLKAGWTE